MPSTKRKEAAEATRAKVLDVARGLFTRFGFDAVNLRQVASLSGYSTGAIFASFSSKEDLFHAAMGADAPALSLPAFLDKIIAADESTQVSDKRSIALYELAFAARVLRVHLVGTPE